MKKLKYHFQAEKGWINDPNGLAYYHGRIHMFYQHNPKDVKWDTMHWGHAVSTDLIHWEELPIAMRPDKKYENGMGCWSGSAIEKDDKLYVMYTAVGKPFRQTQCLGRVEETKIAKYPENPVIAKRPWGAGMNFRDPKVTYMLGHYYMVVGTGKWKKGKVVLYRSDDLLAWEYLGVIYEGCEYAPAIECPDFFPLGDKYVLTFSVMRDETCSTRFVTGTFDGEHFRAESMQKIELGHRFYAAQSFDYKGRRIMIGWLREIYEEGDVRCGAMSIPREITLEGGVIRAYPVKEAAELVCDHDDAVSVTDSQKGKQISYKGSVVYDGPADAIDYLRDGRLLEVYINHGEKNLILF